ncbi:MAG: hypothetical protein LC776_02785 [Acidobacteria bacterium]|nr:hypothetical protein [Acidobacteriota bacterium]
MKITSRCCRSLGRCWPARGHGGASLTVTKLRFAAKQAFSHSRGTASDAAGGLVDVFAADAPGEALGVVPAAQNASSAEADVRGDLADGEHRALAGVTPEPARAADLDDVGLEAAAVGSHVSSASLMHGAAPTQEAGPCL